MRALLDELVKLLTLERLEENLFRGQSQDLGWGQVFGGQVLGQALSAATQTVPSERPPHSRHAYFRRPGDVTKPIVYAVDRARDGGSFTTRRVVAIQNGATILNLAASFQAPEEGFEHQDEMPAAPPPESLPTEQERASAVADKLPAWIKDRLLGDRPFEVRISDMPDDLFHPTPRPPHRMVWLKTSAPLPDDPALHRYLLAYASDNAFIGTALMPHGVSFLTPGKQIASLDHAMWFHRPFRIDEWLLHVMDSPSASESRGLVRGRVFTRDGRLVASTIQEGLIRKRVAKPSSG
jgi:acyl-CoA thioesterase-2